MPNIFKNINYVGVDEKDLPTVYRFMHINKELLNHFCSLLPLY